MKIEERKVTVREVAENYFNDAEACGNGLCLRRIGESDGECDEVA